MPRHQKKAVLASLALTKRWANRENFFSTLSPADTATQTETAEKNHNACADSYQSQTVKNNEKSLKLDGATSSVMFFGRRGKIKTFRSIIPGIDFPFYLSTQMQSNKVCQKLLQRRVIFVISTTSTNPYVKTCQTMLSEH